MIAISWGHGIDETAACLMLESRKTREKGKSYALQTACQAAAAIERRRQQQPLRYREAEYG